MNGLIILAFKIFVAMVGYTIHGSVFWSIIDFIFSPIVLIKWLIYHEITFEIIKQTFAFLG
jgi:hypothetical protein